MVRNNMGRNDFITEYTIKKRKKEKKRRAQEPKTGTEAETKEEHS